MKKPRVFKKKDRTCKCCGNNFQAAAHNAKFCSADCYRKYGSELKYQGKEGVDFVTCPVCLQRTRQLNVAHAKMHGFISVKEMLDHYGLTVACCEAKAAQHEGENNPGYQHGGKYSAWSEKFIHSYDEERHTIAKEKHRKFLKDNPDKCNTKVEYYLDAANSDLKEAKRLLAERQTTFSLTTCIEKYGETEGRRIWQKRQDKWQDTLNDKPIEELLQINARKVRKSFCFYSKGEKELFEALKGHIPEIKDQLAVCKNPFDCRKRFYLYDMVFGTKIIEYNGDFWHANPKLYDDTFVNPYTKQTAAQIREGDAIKISTAIKNGYEVMVVWESDYRGNKEEVINKCLSYLTQ